MKTSVSINRKFICDGMPYYSVVTVKGNVGDLKEIETQILSKQECISKYGGLHLNSNFYVKDDDVITVHVNKDCEMPVDCIHDLDVTYVENKTSVWNFFKILADGESQVVYDKLTLDSTDLIDCTFSASTPNITVTFNIDRKFKSKIIWGYFEENCIVDFAITGQTLQNLYDAGFRDSIMECETLSDDDTDSLYLITVNTSKLDKMYATEDETVISFSVHNLLSNFSAYDITDTILIGLRCGLRATESRLKLNITDMSRTSFYEKAMYPYNLVISREYSRPTVSKFKKKLNDNENTFWLDKITSCTTYEEINNTLTRYFIQECKDTPFVKAFLDGFDKTYSFSDTVRYNEFDSLKTKVNTMKFKYGLDWFKYKIQIMMLKILSVTGKAYNLHNGYVSLNYSELSFMLGVD